MLIASACSCGAVSRTPATKLIKRLWKLQKVGIMIGHQDDPVYGSSWKWDEGRSDVRDVCGDYPAVMGFDLGKIEYQADKNLDGVPFSRMRKEIIAQYNRGGIIALSWHPDNPVTGKDTWDASGNAVKEILPEGSLNSKFEGWLQHVANFINSLTTEKGVKIPVIFRPWHEMNGAWFWWGSKSCTPQELQNLYRFTFHKLVKEYHCNNIVWAYSPNYQENNDEDQYLKYYPGNEFVDLIGIDIYDFDHNNHKYMEHLSLELNLITSIGADKKKLVAITETGAQRLPDSNWFTQVFWQVAKNYKLSYALFWRNAWDTEKEIYMTSPGHATATDFKALFNLKKTLFVNDIKNIK